jgi:glutamine---fructose-6-phosphate transaminase (isomerizing)
LCGIIGYNGFRDANNVLVDCLKRLEYRGYDSAGIAILNNDLQVFKETGYISKLEEELKFNNEIKGSIGIGHTRWATHGRVTKTNAHPHISSNKKIAVVHNGIIENFKQLKEYLMNKGYTFSSETDSEVLSHLIEDNYNGNLQDAVYNAMKKVNGYYAIVVMSKDEPNVLVGTRKDSPLVIGSGDNENFIASDITALLKYTNRVIYLNDAESVVITNKNISLYDSDNKPINREETLISWDVADAEKSGFPHFMLKEIYEQDQTVHQVTRGRLSEIDRTINFDEIVENLLVHDYDNIQIIACGTSYYAGLMGKYFFESFAKIPVFVDLASEYRYYGSFNEKSLVIAVTQSGETLDTLAALKKAKSIGCKTLVITNVIGSSATRISDGTILTQSGPEIGVAATKTFTAQVLVLLLLSLKLGKMKRYIGTDDLFQYIIQMKQLPIHVKYILDHNKQIKEIAEILRNARSVFFIGRGINFPLCLEGALKLKEISYIHAEGFAAGELKHGPFALLTKDTPVIAISSKDVTYEKIISNIGEIKARGPQVIAISEEQDTEIEKYADFVLRYPSDTGVLSFIPIIIILQLLAYYVADLKGCSIDKPRNLAKSVTVE